MGAEASDAPRTAVSSDEELLALRRAEAAERSGNPRLALYVLGELDHQSEGGELLEERAAVAVIAKCALGFGGKLFLAREFLTRYPQSVYEERVRQECEVPAGPAGDDHAPKDPSQATKLFAPARTDLPSTGD